MSSRLGLDEDAAGAEQRRLVAQPGTTLRGLMNVHEIDLYEFLAWEEELDYSVLSPDAELHDCLSRLEPSVHVMTNGSHAYAEVVLDRLGLRDVVDGVWGVDGGGFVPKP